MLVLPPPSPVSYGQIARAVAAILLTVLVVPLIWIVRHKLRIARAITPIPGPRGMPLLGMLPELMKNLPRIFHFQVQHLTTSWVFFMLSGLVRPLIEHASLCEL